MVQGCFKEGLVLDGYNRAMGVEGSKALRFGVFDVR